MAPSVKHYPDISDVLAAKETWRKSRAALSFGEKLDALDALRERVKPIIEARRKRQSDAHRAGAGFSDDGASQS